MGMIFELKGSFYWRAWELGEAKGKAAWASGNCSRKAQGLCEKAVWGNGKHYIIVAQLLSSYYHQFLLF